MELYSGFGEFFMVMLGIEVMLIVMCIVGSIIAFFTVVVKKIKGENIKEIGCREIWEKVFPMLSTIVLGIFMFGVIAFPVYNLFSYTNKALEKIMQTDFSFNGEGTIIQNCTFANTEPLTITDEVHFTVGSLQQAEDTVVWSSALYDCDSITTTASGVTNDKQ